MRREWVSKGGRGYWQNIWAAEDSHSRRVVILLVGGGYYISAHQGSVPREEDIGPYPSFEEARDAADIIMDLNAAPEHWGVKRL